MTNHFDQSPTNEPAGLYPAECATGCYHEWKTEQQLDEEYRELLRQRRNADNDARAGES